MSLLYERDGHTLRPEVRKANEECARGFVPADYFDKHPLQAPPAYRALSDPAPLRIPNRLFGATITPEGDAT